MWLSLAIAKASSPPSMPRTSSRPWHPTMSKQDQNILALNHVSIMMEKIVVRR